MFFVVLLLFFYLLFVDVFLLVLVNFSTPRTYRYIQRGTVFVFFLVFFLFRLLGKVWGGIRYLVNTSSLHILLDVCRSFVLV